MSNSTYIIDESLLASKGSRILNYILDIIFTMLLIFVLAFVLAILAGIFQWNGILLWLSDMSDLSGQVVFLGVAIFYYTITEAFLGRSLAKFITGTTVVDENGQKPDFGTILKRSLCRLIPFDALSFLGNSGRGWHDSISDTYVVNKKDLAENLKTFHEFNLIGVQEVEA
ncbi:RDD family protein [Flavobacterium sp. LBUM151]